MAGRGCPFLESDDPESSGDSMISSITTEERGAEVTLPRHFYSIHPNPSLTPLI